MNPLIAPSGGGGVYGVPDSLGVRANVDVDAGIRVPGVPSTHSRVALMLLGAGAVLAGLKLAGFRFNVGVTS